MGASWFETGNDGVAREKMERERKREVPFRFWIRPGQVSKVVFLDDFTKTRVVELPGSGEIVNQPVVPFCFNEHNLTVDGDWRNWYTCLGKSDPPCPICDQNHYKTYIGIYSVLCSWTEENGTEHWTKKVFPCKIDAIERVRMQQNAYTEDGRIKERQFKHCMFRVMRTTQKSAVTGDSLELIKQLTPEEVTNLLPAPTQGQQPLDIEPYDYMKIFAPKPKDELTTLMASGRVQAARKKGAATTQQADMFSGEGQDQQKSTIGSPPSDLDGGQTETQTQQTTGQEPDKKSSADAIDF